MQSALSGAAVVWPLATLAQQPAKMKRIAFVTASAKISELVASNNRYRPWFEELHRLGYVEGQNIAIERYSAEDRTDRYDELARDVVSTNPDVIFVIYGRLALAFKKSTTTIPIACVSPDPIALGIVSNLAHPGGNITGVSIDAGIEVVGKRLGLLLEAIPRASNISYLSSRYGWEAAQGRTVRESAKQRRISISAALLEGTIDEAQYRETFTAMERNRVDAMLVSGESTNFTHRQLIVDLAAKTRIPALYSIPESVELGGLMAYGYDSAIAYSRAANVIDQILKGVSAGEIPFYQATKFELVINLKTAKALGLELPATLLGSADEVIE